MIDEYSVTSMKGRSIRSVFLAEPDFCFLMKPYSMMEG
ncbi:hypothetical protein RV02_GL000949 [Enterococcus gilvus]|nr:hypothetical protein RV02_GL000949 [Enterococcus gilvus]